jgi:hypothetical protein
MARRFSGAIGGTGIPSDEAVATALANVTEVSGVLATLIAAGLVRETVPDGALVLPSGASLILPSGVFLGVR